MTSEYSVTFKVLCGGWEGKEEQDAIRDMIAGETALGYEAKHYDSWPRKPSGWTVMVECKGIVVADSAWSAKAKLHTEHSFWNGIVTSIEILEVMPFAEEEDV